MHILATENIVQQYPYSPEKLRRDNPQTSFPDSPTDELLASYNVFPVTPTPSPAFNPASQKVEEGVPVSVDGVWMQVWDVSPLSDAEVQQYLRDLQKAIIAQTQQRLDDFARTRSYDGILSLCTYATSPNAKFAAEGQYGVEARDATWTKLYQMLAEIEAGTRPIPSGYSDIEPELPALAWPA